MSQNNYSFDEFAADFGVNPSITDFKQAAEAMRNVIDGIEWVSPMDEFLAPAIAEFEMACHQYRHFATPFSLYEDENWERD